MTHINAGGCRNGLTVRTCNTCADSPKRGGNCPHYETALMRLQHSSVDVILGEIDNHVRRGEVKP